MSSLTSLASRYQLADELGRGGMSVVYRALDLQNNRPVAIKVLSDKLAHDLPAILRFKREAQTAASLSHPNICSLYDISEEGGRFFLVMALLEGETLKRRLTRGQCEPEFVTDLARQVTEGLRAAHAKFIVHRDINPSNVFVTTDGTVKILDFGIAKHFAGLDAGIESEAVTGPGAILGTVDYMSPEQLLGRRIDHRSDLFALGALLYEVLTGRPPFRAKSDVETIAGILHAPAPPLPPVVHGVEWSHIINRLLAKDPDGRYADADELLADLARLEQIVAGQQPFWSPLVSTMQERAASSVAVLPFDVVAGDSDQDDRRKELEYFSHSLVEELYRALARLPHLRVVSPTLASRPGHSADPVRIGRRLRADTVLTGTVRSAQDRMAIVVTLSGVQEHAPLWEQRYEVPGPDLFRVRDQIASAVAAWFEPQALRPTMPHHAFVQNPRAFRLYLQGRFHWNKRYQGGLRTACRCFEEAIREDPTSALAHAGLADTESFLGFYCLKRPRDAFAAAKQSVEQALRLDAGLPEAQTSLGLIKLGGEWDLDGAEQAFRRAFDLDPFQALPRIYLSWVLVLLGRFEEAYAEAGRAQDIDPMAPILNAGAGYTFFLSRAYDRAIRECEKALEVDREFLVALYVMGMCYAQKGMCADAVNQLEYAVKLSQGMPFYLGLLGKCYADLQRFDDVEGVLAQLQEKSREQYVPPHCYVYIHAALGEFDRAFEWQDKAFEDGASPFNYFSPIIECLHADPRFKEDLRAWGLDV